MEMMDMAADDTREELRRKLRSNFDGRIVRKDLTFTHGFSCFTSA